MSNCKEIDPILGCYDDGVGPLVTVVIHYEYGVDAAGASILVSTRYTDAAGAVIDTTGGTVTPGACAVAGVPTPDVEYEQLCDDDGAGTITPFFRRSLTTFTAAGAIDTVTVDDFELDKTTAYVPAGTVGKCADECAPSTAQGVLTTWG